jgi:hypothetical protein
MVPRQARLSEIKAINGAVDIEGVSGGINASSVNGTVRAQKIAGDVRLSTVNGKLEATFERLSDAKMISMNSVNGPISLSIPYDAGAEFNARNVTGGIDNDFGIPVSQDHSAGSQLHGVLKGGGTYIDLKNVNGPFVSCRCPTAAASNSLSGADLQVCAGPPGPASRSIMLQDLDYALRMLLRGKGYTAVAVLALALGIGANTAIFSVADAFLLKPVALPNLENLVVLMERAPHQTANWTNVAPANYLDWKRQSGSFAVFSPYEWDDVNLTGTGEPERVMAARAAANFFELLGAKPMLGRVFLPEDARSGPSQTVVLSYGLWKRRYGADRTIVGQTIKLDGLSRTVIGVMDKKFNFPVSVEMWVPWTMDPQESQVRGHHYLEILSRLKPGVSLRQASAEMTAISRRMAQQYPETNRGWDAQVVPIKYFVTGDLTYRYTVMLMAAVMGCIADRLRQRGQPAIRARRGAAKRVRGTHGAGRESLAGGAPTAHREPYAFARGRGRRPGPRRLGCGSDPTLHAGRYRTLHRGLV